MLRGFGLPWSAAPFWRTSFPAPLLPRLRQRATRKKRLRTRSRLCATGSNAFSPRNRKAWRRSHHALRPRGKRGSPQRPRRQIPRGHFRCGPAWPRLKEAPRWPWQCSAEIRPSTPIGTSTTPTNNAPLHAAGATVLGARKHKKSACQSRTICRSYIEDQTVHSSTCMPPPSPVEALPQQTFRASYKLHANGETLALQHFAPRRTYGRGHLRSFLKRPT